MVPASPHSILCNLQIGLSASSAITTSSDIIQKNCTEKYNFSLLSFFNGSNSLIPTAENLLVLHRSPNHSLVFDSASGIFSFAVIFQRKQSTQYRLNRLKITELYSQQVYSI